MDRMSIIESIFSQALRAKNSQELEKLLGEQCPDAKIRQEVERLLAVDAKAGSFMVEPPEDLAGTHDAENQDVHAIDGQIGPYKIREKIGEGGMGVVYVAEQTEPVQRKVAIKVIKPGMDTKEVIARFEAERQALAFMEHPNIARVLDAGATESGRSYFVMELVRGIPITEYCDQVKATPSERLDLFKTVCDAVQHAHQKGIIHRDIKPSNVLVTQVGAKPVVKVIDFGLAKATSGQKLTDKTVYTGFMKLMGTPTYMSPEQAGLSGLDVDTRSDVYSLGILLYELLTGTTPLDKTEIQKQAYEELCRQIQEVEAPKPSSRISTLKDSERSSIAQQRGVEPKNLRQLLDGDLDVVVLKALEKDRERRYNTPQDLAADVDRFLADEPVLAVPPSSLYRTRKYFRRHRLAILTATAVALSLLVAAGVSTWQAIRASRSAQDAIVAKIEANAARDNAVASEQDAVAARRIADSAKIEIEKTAKQRRRELYAADMLLADHLWSKPSRDNLRRIDELLARWIPDDDEQEDLREFSWRYQMTRLHQSAEVTAYDTYTATVTPSGNMLTADATGLHEWVSTGSSISRWNGDASQATLSPDGRWAAFPRGETTTLIDISSGDAVLEIPYAQFAFSKTGKLFAAWATNPVAEQSPQRGNTIQAWNLANGTPQPRESLDFHGIEPLSRSYGLRLADDGRTFMLYGKSKSQRHYQLYLFDGESDPVALPRTAAFDISSDGEQVAYRAPDGIHVRHRSDPSSVLKVPFRRSLYLSPDASRIAAFNEGGNIELWDVSSLKEPHKQASFVPTAKLLRTIRGPHLEPIRRASGRSLPAFRSMVFSADGSKLVSTSSVWQHSQGVSKLWDVSRVPGRYEIEDMDHDVFSGRVGLTFEETERGLLVSDIADWHEAVSGEIRTGDRIVEVSDDQNGTIDVRNRMNTFMQDKYMMQRVLHGPHGSVVRLRIEKPNEEVRNVALRRTNKQQPNPWDLHFDGNDTVLFADSGGGATSLDLPTNKTQRYPALGLRLAISPDGQLLAMTDNVDVVLWDRRLNRERCRLDGRATGIVGGGRGDGSLAFSPDGEFLAMVTGVALNDSPSDLKVWRLSNLEEVGPRFQGNSNLSAIKFTSDSSRLIAVDCQGEIRIWNTSTWELERTLHSGRLMHMALAISHDDRILATYGAHTTLWDLESGRKLHVMNGPFGRDLAFSPDDRTLVSAAGIAWDVKSGKQLQMLDHGESTHLYSSVAFSPDGNTLAVLSNDALQLWQAASLDEIESYRPTHDAMLKRGVVHNEQKRHADAERILRRLFELQQKHLQPDDPNIGRTRSEIKRSLIGQGKMPVIARQPESKTGNLGDEITFRVEFAEPSPLDLQWYRNGQAIDGANSAQLAFAVESKADYGAYRLEAAPVGRKDTMPLRSEFAFLVEEELETDRGLSWEVFNDIQGNSPHRLKAAEAFMRNQPDERSIIKHFEIPSNVGENYGGRLSGWLIPPVTGEYVFFLAGDDMAELYLSDSETPDGEELIARSAWWQYPRMWNWSRKTLVELVSSDVIRSRPIYLERGKRYSIRALFKEGPGQDYFAVTWQMPGQPPPENGDSPIPGLFLRHSRE